VVTWRFAIGGGKVTQIPVLDIRDWRMVRRDAQHAVFRPSMKTFGRRLGWTLLCAVLAGLSYFSLREYLDTAMVPMEDTQALGSLVADTNWMLESMRRGMSPEEWSRLKADLERSKAEAEARQAADLARREAGSRWFRRGLMAFVIALGLAGMLPPIATLWNHLTIERTPQGGLVMRSRSVVPRRREWAPGTIGRLPIQVREHITRGRHGRMEHRGWRWHVYLAPAAFSGAPGELPVLAEIIADWQPSRPMDNPPLTPRVEAVVSELGRLCGARPDRPVVVDAAVERSWLGTRITQQAEFPAGAPFVQKSEIREEYNSLDEVPAYLRPQMERMLRQAEAGIPPEGLKSQRFVYRDASGRENVYHSRDEMPPEVREVFDRIHEGDA
jgi:hypothetical protein